MGRNIEKIERYIERCVKKRGERGKKMGKRSEEGKDEKSVKDI